MTPEERENAISRIYEEMAIKDLTFGCRVKVFGVKDRLVSCEHPDPDKLKVTRYETSRFERSEYDVIGHKIHLPRLLIRLGEREAAMGGRYHEYYYAYGMIMKHENGSGVSVCKWDLGLSMEDQSDKTILYLLSLIDQGAKN